MSFLTSSGSILLIILFIYREARRKKAEEPRKIYKNSLWSDTSEVFGSQKVVYIGEDPKEPESDENVVHRYVLCERSYIQAPNNVSMIKNKNIQIH